MEISRHILSSVDDAHKFFRGYRSHPPGGWWFRGQPDVDWSLIPKAGRPEFKLPGSRALGRFNSWSKQAIAYDSTLPQNEWERLAVAQHFGLATCLLDWSCNPLVALYFASSQFPEKAGAVFCYDPEFFVQEEVLDLKTAKCVGYGFTPRAISRRIIQQRAVFTVHLPSDSTIQVKASSFAADHPNLVQVVVPSELKSEFLQMLNDYGINQVTLFPDLEGLSAHVNWETRAMANRKRGNT